MSLTFFAITTFNAAGLDLYGRRMMASWRRHWPSDVARLRVYSEDWPAAAAPEADLVVPLLVAQPWLAAFKTDHRGRIFRDYRWDAVRFAHKIAAVCHAARTSDADVLIWVDGDVVTHAPLAADDLAGLAPRAGAWIAWLDRDGSYPECGFFTLDLRHPRHVEAIDALEAMYVEERLFGLAEQHDSFVIRHVVTSLGLAATSLSGEGRRFPHPMINGPLGAWFDHLKGPRKRLGRSRASDLKVKRGERHWVS